jgi:hypothetical protein
MLKTRLNTLWAHLPSPTFGLLSRWRAQGILPNIISFRSDNLVGGRESGLRGQTLKEFREQIIALVRGKIADSTLLQYDASLRALLRIVGDPSLSSLRPYHFELFTARRLEEVSPVRVNIEFRALRALFARAAHSA